MEDHSAETYLLNIPLWTKKKNSLSDVRAFLEEMGNPDDTMNVIHVAGTNGKGSVCAFLTSMLIEAGYRVGTFISPHLVDIKERFLLDGQMIGQSKFEASFEQVNQIVKKMTENGYAHPSFFEFLFYMAVWLFSHENVDYLILETGLGGKLDTTNVIRRPLACVITSISLDHMEYLGGTVEEIAGEKAGIIKAGIPVIYDASQKNIGEMIERRALLQHSESYPVEEKSLNIQSNGMDGILVEGNTKDGGRITLSVPFAADYQAVNAMVAIRTLEVIHPDRLTVNSIKSGIKKMVWPGRMEQVLPGVYLDGAHNIGGIRAFTKAAKKLQEETGKSAYLLFAAVSDKDYGGMIAHICSELSLKGIMVAHIDNQRGVKESDLAEIFCRVGNCPVEVFTTAEEAMSYALQQKAENELLFGAGSLYLIGEILAYLGGIRDD